MSSTSSRTGSAGDGTVALRPMREEDLALVEGWLVEPHVAKWWLVDTTPAVELDEMRRFIRGDDTRTRMLTVCLGQRPIGWAEWYWRKDYPESAAIGATAEAGGMDYAIGDPAFVARGIGTQMIAALVREIRRERPGVGIVVDPDERNRASRRVLERNGFELVGIRPAPWGAAGERFAVYCLPREEVRLAGVEGATAAARLLDQFNREFDEPSPGVPFLQERIASLMRGGEIDVLLGGARPDGTPAGVAVLRFRPSIWTSGTECYLAEFYVTPERRNLGLGRAMLEEAMSHARRRGADYLSIEVDEPDAGARHLYESVGFTNRIDGSDDVMFVYERDLGNLKPGP